VSWVDVTLVVLGVVAAAIGLYTGVLRVLMALAGLAVGVWVAWRFAPPLAEGLESWMSLSQPAARLVATGTLLLATLAVAALLTWLLTRSLKLFRLGWLDRGSGALVALLLVALAAGFVAFNLGVDAEGETTLGDSRILPALVRGLETLREWAGFDAEQTACLRRGGGLPRGPA
jgi:uncharacterized membrane protein required for colicin V production